MPVFITIQSETCFIMCSDTFPHTRYERQISPFMPHWAGTWSWIIKTNRSGETQNRTAEKRDGRQKERRAMVHFRRKSPRDACRIPGCFLTASDTAVAPGLIEMCIFMPAVSPWHQAWLYHCLLDPGWGTPFWRQPMFWAQLPQEADQDKERHVESSLGSMVGSRVVGLWQEQD